MIVQWLVDAFTAVVNWFIGIWPIFDPPTWLSSIGDGISWFSDKVASTSAWLPWQAIGLTIPVLLAATGVALSIWVIRWVQSTFTGGGGNVS